MLKEIAIAIGAILAIIGAIVGFIIVATLITAGPIVLIIWVVWKLFFSL